MALFSFGRRKNKYNRDLINEPERTNRSIEKGIVESSPESIWKLVSELRDLTQSYEYRFAEYDIMEADVIIKAALETYADDATQKDLNATDMFRVESGNDATRKDLTALLNRLKIQEKMWNTAYNVGKYGNKYWKIYLTEDKKDISHLEEIEDPGCCLDLYYEGEGRYYAFTENDRTLLKSAQEYELYDHNSFIHFFIHQTTQIDTIELDDHKNVDENGDPIIYKYKVMLGESMIEAVRVIYRILRTLEDAMLATKLAKSEYVRLYNVEVGDSNNTDARLIVNKVKKLFDSQVSLDLREGTYNARKQARPYMDPIFNAVQHGKGAISVDTIGGDFQVKDIVDIDYFNNKLFAGLHMPKSFLGFEDSLPGSLNGNGSTLVQLDIRYARFIKKLIECLSTGVEDLCNIWLELKGRSNEIGKFKIVCTSPSSAEELCRIQELQSRVDTVNNLANTISSVATGVNKAKLLKELIDEFVPYPDFVHSIDKLLNDAIFDADLEIKAQKSSNELMIKSNEQQIEQIDNPQSADASGGGSSIDAILAGIDDSSEGDESTGEEMIDIDNEGGVE